MAENLQFQINYAGGSYVDASVSVTSISELVDKFDFIGQSVHMTEAFVGVNEVPYPVDFWMIPNGEDVKWCIKSMPSIESEGDLEKFKSFSEEFKTILGYYPMTIGFEFFVNGEKYVFGNDENGVATYTTSQTTIDEYIDDTVALAVDEAVNKVTSGASEAFDTLKEIEDWISANSGNTPDLSDYATKEEVANAVDGLASETYVNEQIADIEFPETDLTGYATEVWVEEKNYLTEHQSLEGYATEGYVDNKISEIEMPVIDHLATKEEVASAVNGLATESWVSAEIAKAQLEGEDVDLSGYATKDDIKDFATKEETEAIKTWVGEQGFLTEHQSLEGLATEQFVTDRISEIQIPETGHLATKDEVANAVEGLATEEFVTNQGYITEHQDISYLATKEEVNEIVKQIPSIDGLATETYVDEKVASINIPSIEGLATEAWVNEQGFLTEHQDITGKQDVIEDLEAIREGAAKGATALQEVPEEYITNEELEAKGYLTEHQDLSEYAKKEELPTLEGYATETWVSAEIAKAQLEGEDVDLSGYATKDDIANLATKDEVPSVEGLASEAWVNEQGFLTEHQDISGLATKEETEAVKTWVNEQGFLTEHQDLSEYAKKEELPSVEGLASEAWVNEQGFLTEHQDISGLATKEEVANAIAEIEIPSIEGLATEQFVTDEIAKIEIPSIDHLATKEELEIVSGSIKSVIEDLLIPENAKETLDTLEEISAWIQSHPDDAASMNAQIVALQESAHTHENKDVLDGITTEKVAAWDAAEANAKGYANDEIAKLSDVYAKKTDIEGLATETWVSTEIAKAQLEGEDIDLSGYATKDDIKDFASEQFVTDEIAKIEIPTLDGYATEAWVGEQGFITEHQDISGLATKEEVSEAVSSAQTYADSLVENLKPYDGGTAVDVVDYTVNVNVAEDGFLKVNEENELTVTGVTLDAAVTSKDITIEGGQWEESVKSVFTDGVVPAGTTWESFLESMLCVEKWATSVSVSTAFTVSCGNINPGIDKSGTVEVGTKVTLNETNANTTNASQSLIVKTFGDSYGKVYGYKMGENDSHVNATAYTETLTPNIKVSEDALKITFSKFTDQLNGGKVLDTISGNTTLPSVVMYAMEGTNVVTVSQTGDTYTASSAVTAGTIYIATNLKNYYKTDKVTPNTIIPTFESTDKTATDSTEYKVIGAHKYFIGDIMDYSIDYWDEDRSSEVRGLETKNWATASTITIAHTFKMGTKQQTVVVPAKYTSVSGKDVNNGDVKFNLVKTFDFTNEQGYISSFKVFVAPATDGLGSDSKITITIK